MARRLTAKEKIARMLEQHSIGALLKAILPYAIERAADLANSDHETPEAFWAEIRAGLISAVDADLTAAQSAPGDRAARRLAEIAERAQYQEGLAPERRPAADLDAAIRRAFGIDPIDPTDESEG